MYWRLSIKIDFFKIMNAAQTNFVDYKVHQCQRESKDHGFCNSEKIMTTRGRWRCDNRRHFRGSRGKLANWWAKMGGCHFFCMLRPPSQMSTKQTAPRQPHNLSRKWCHPIYKLGREARRPIHQSPQQIAYWLPPDGGGAKKYLPLIRPNKTK